MMFVWHSSNTEESGAALAAAIGCEHGTVPPANYEGDVIVYGGNPAANFNWAGRKFGKIINDPRALKDIKDKESLAQKIALGIPFRAFYVNGKFVKAVRTDGGDPAVINTDATTCIRNLIDNVISLTGKPLIMAADGVYTNAKAGRYSSVMNVILAPAITEHPDVIKAIKDAFVEDDKEVLTKVINTATPDELRAIRKLFRSISAD